MIGYVTLSNQRLRQGLRLLRHPDGGDGRQADVGDGKRRRVGQGPAAADVTRWR